MQYFTGVGIPNNQSILGYPVLRATIAQHVRYATTNDPLAIGTVGNAIYCGGLEFSRFELMQFFTGTDIPDLDFPSGIYFPSGICSKFAATKNVIFIPFLYRDGSTDNPLAIGTVGDESVISSADKRLK